MENFLSQINLKRPRFCPKPDHENNRISFICIEDHCFSDSRLGCAYCFLENHQTHIQNKLKIEIFEEKLEEKLRDLTNFYCETPQNDMDNRIFSRIEADFDLLKKDFLRNITNIQDNIMDCYRRRMKIILREKEKVDEFIGGLSEMSKKRVFDMNEQELQINIDIFQDKSLSKVPKNFLKDFEEKEIKIKEAIFGYLRDFRGDFEVFFRRLCENHGISALNAKLTNKNKASSPQKTQKTQKPIVFSKTVSAKFNEMKYSSANFDRKKVKRVQYELVKKNAKNYFEIFELKSCEHLKKIKMALIFPCCNKAFLCYKCHDKVSNDHKWDLRDEVNLGYCLKCYTIAKYKDEKCSNCLLGLK